LGGGGGGCIFGLAAPDDIPSIVKYATDAACIHVPFQVDTEGCKQIL
jgi:hypothetical protein